MNWVDLLSPLRRAVRDLLFRIEGATQDGPKGDAVAANCFLVYGDRGTGKTTVLLSAQRACTKNTRDDFFKGSEENKKDHLLADDARARAGSLQNVVWLDVLDLEPLPPRANLLTTVLTRVRNALDKPGHEKKARDLTSILEEGADSARHKLNQLIKDATLMWEDILEPDTRSLANREIAAADIYAEFRYRFKGAMDTLSLELGRRSGSVDTHRSIVLPVDNIDRSTDHLYHIIKLAQMVSCPHLWLVMAGDRQDVDTFLERAFWKELIRIGEGAGATGKAGLGGEDEALVMARRQAAAASHKLLPPSHRVEVRLVEPKETLEFSGAADKNEEEKIRNMLKKIVVTDGFIGNNDPGKERKKKGKTKINLLDIFDMTSRVTEVVGETHKEHLTEAAELGLRLSARGVLDLWQITRGVVLVRKDETVTGARQAEQIVRTMLRNAITESMMSSEIGRLLQDRIMRRTRTGGIVLDFWDPTEVLPSKLQVLRLLRPKFELPLAPQAREFWPSGGMRSQNAFEKSYLTIESTLRVMYSNGLILRLTHSPRAKAGGTLTGGEREMKLDIKYLPPSEREGTGSDILPDLVSGWLISLYDVIELASATDSTVISRPAIRAPVVFERSHETSEEGRFEREWPMPSWERFIAYDLNGQLWRHFLSALARKRGRENLRDQAAREGYLTRLLTVGWVACALETFFSFPPPGDWPDAGGIFEALKSSILGCDLDRGKVEKTIQAGEKEVLEAAARLYEGILSRPEEGMQPMKIWLERDLPLLLIEWDLEMPKGSKETMMSAHDIINYLKPEPKKESSTLLGAWRRNALDVWNHRLEANRRLFPAGMTLSAPMRDNEDPFQMDQMETFGGLTDWFEALFPELFELLRVRFFQGGTTGNAGQ